MTPGWVAINARATQRRELGGVERWARELAHRLPRLRPDRYRVLAPPPSLAHRAGHAWEQAALPIAARNAALILSPANLAPLASGHRNVVVIHDAAPLRGPAWYGRAYGGWHRLLLPRIAQGAQLVLVPSQFVANELRQLFDLPATAVRVVAPGVGHGPSIAPPRSGVHATDPPDVAAVRVQLGLDRPYVLAVGTDSARKNFALLDAIAPSLAREGIEVVIAGSSRSYLRKAKGVGARRLGYVPDELLPGLYAGAAVFTMPSVYEGFGLPCIEAMAAGVPVVAASCAALPETCDDAATLVSPGDHDAFTRALLDAALDAVTRARLVAAGRARASLFNWSSTAQTIDDLITERLDG